MRSARRNEWGRWLSDNSEAVYNFVSTGACPELPAIRLKAGGGEQKAFDLRYPLNEADAKAILERSVKSGFGRGSSTLFDPSIRSGSEITQTNFQVDDGWTERVLKGQILKRVQEELKIDGRLRAEPYKLLCYQTGDHFKKHLDTLRGYYHVATLILFLPSVYVGGALVVEQHAFAQTERHTFSFGQDERIEGRWVAFFPDCPHSISPVVSGYRVTVQYNLFVEYEHYDQECGPMCLKRRKLTANVNNQAVGGRAIIDWAEDLQNADDPEDKLADREEADAKEAADGADADDADEQIRKMDEDAFEGDDKAIEGDEKGGAAEDASEGDDKTMEGDEKSTEAKAEVGLEVGVWQNAWSNRGVMGLGYVLEHQYSLATLTPDGLRGKDNDMYRMLERSFGPNPFRLADDLSFLPHELLSLIRAYLYRFHTILLQKIDISMSGGSAPNAQFDSEVLDMPASYVLHPNHVNSVETKIYTDDNPDGPHLLDFVGESDHIMAQRVTMSRYIREGDADRIPILFNDPITGFQKVTEEADDSDQQSTGNSGTSFDFQYFRAAIIILPAPQPRQT